MLAPFGLIGALFLAACGNTDLSPLCDKAEECAKKAGSAFSRSECVNDAKAEREKADTRGCGEEYQAFVDCATGLRLECGDDLPKKLAAECGGKISAFNKCAE